MTHRNTVTDIWSTGLIVAEMLMRTPVLPGVDSQHQVELICRLLGKPPLEFIQQARKQCFRHLLSNSPERLVTCKHTQFREFFPNASEGALLLLVSCLSFDPCDRITAKEALRLDYFMNYDGIPYTTAITTQRCDDRDSFIDMEELKVEFSFEEHTLTVEELRKELLQEVRKYCGSSRGGEGRGGGSGGEQKDQSTPMAYTDGSSDGDDDDDDEEEHVDVVDDGTVNEADEEMQTAGSIAMDTTGHAPPFNRPGGQEPGSARGNNSSRCEPKSSVPSSSTIVRPKRTIAPPTIVPPLPSSFISTPMSTKITPPPSTRAPLDILQTTTPIPSLLSQQQQLPSLAVETEATSSHPGIASTQTIHSKPGGFGRPLISQQQQQEGDRQGRNKVQDFFHNMCKQS